MGPVQYLEILAGLAILVTTFYDLFQAIVLPRPSVYRLPLISRRLGRGPLEDLEMGGPPAPAPGAA